MSSMIQKPRPNVETTRSLKSSCTVIQLTGTRGSWLWNGSQFAPSSKDKYNPLSVPR